jgi:hypothetical protein
MEESAVYLKYSGQGFAHDAIALWVLVKAIVVLPDHLYCMRMVVLLVNNEMLGFLSQPNLWLSRLLALFGFAFVSFSSVCFFMLGYECFGICFDAN